MFLFRNYLSSFFRNYLNYIKRIIIVLQLHNLILIYSFRTETLENIHYTEIRWWNLLLLLLQFKKGYNCLALRMKYQIISKVKKYPSKLTSHSPKTKGEGFQFDTNLYIVFDCVEVNYFECLLNDPVYLY